MIHCKTFIVKFAHSHHLGCSTGSVLWVIFASDEQILLGYKGMLNNNLPPFSSMFIQA